MRRHASPVLEWCARALCAHTPPASRSKAVLSRHGEHSLYLRSHCLADPSREQSGFRGQEHSPLIHIYGRAPPPPCLPLFFPYLDRNPRQPGQ
eukprot:1448268-Rhodomonas_salina.3